MKRTFTTALIALLASSSSPAPGDAVDWLTPEKVDGAAQELVERLTSVGFVPTKSPEELLDGARSMIEAMRAELAARGGTGMAEIAPTFEGVELPPSGSDRLDRMGSYNLCFVALSIQIRNPSLRDDVRDAFATALGVSATSIASSYLRHLYLESGGDPDALPAYTAHAGRREIFDGLFRDATLRGRVLDGCRPAVRSLVGSSLQRLIDQALFESPTAR